MRFILKSAFWLGLIAFLLPIGERGESGANISWFGALAGAQQALQDIGGFCNRAPEACNTGREVAVFTGERIGDGLALAYDFVEKRRETGAAAPAPQAVETVELAPPVDTDPMSTGTVGPLVPLPRAYIAPKRSLSPVATSPAEPGAPARIAIPTPAPRA